MAPLVRTGGSRHTGLAALPHRNIQGGVKHMEKLIYLAEKAGKAAIKMGKQSVQKSPICGLFEPRIPKQLKK